MNKEQIESACIALDVDGQRCLFIVLGKDGTVNRLGSGAPDNSDHDLYVGKTEEPLFDRFIAPVTNELLDCAGGYDSPSPQGKPCCLRILFEGGGGETGFEFTYGTESEGPPDNIVELLISAIEITDAWHADQKKQIAEKGATPAKQG